MAVSILSSSKNVIHTKLDSTTTEWPEYVTFIYGPPTESERRVVWNQVRDIAGHMTGTWLCIGDFNDLLSQEDKMRGNPHTLRRILSFQSFVTDCTLMEIEAKGARYTWCNQRTDGDHVKEKIDRTFGNPSFNDTFPKALVLHIEPVASDHHILLLQLCFVGIKCPCPFRFAANWVTHPEFKAIMHECWQLEYFAGEGGVRRFVERLNECQRLLIRWSKQAFPNNRRVIADLVKKIEILKESVYTEVSKNQIESLKEQVSEFWHREETYWWLRSRANWIKAGDLNTSFFHKKTVIRQQRNLVLKIKDQEGGWVESEEGVADLVANFYSSLFKSSHSDKGLVLDYVKPAISDQQNSWLTLPITEAEVKEATFQLGAFKAPGSDGFNGHFYQRSWDEVKTGVTEMVRGFFDRDECIDALNVTNLILIPKVDHPESASQYRPISLCNFSYKIIAKILANRMRLVLDSCISEQQRAFIPNRLIQDNSIIVHEAFHYLKNKRASNKCEVALKMDMNEAYDRL